MMHFIDYIYIFCQSQKLSDDLMKDNMPKKIRKRSESRGYYWFSWRRNNQTDPETNKNSTDTEKNSLPSSQSKEVLFVQTTQQLKDTYNRY